MKKYKRRMPLISPFKIAIAALCAAMATAAVIAFTGTDNAGYIMCGGITVSLIICDLFIIIGACGRYRYWDECIEVFHLLLNKKLKYSCFGAIVISNASYNNGYGYGINVNIPMMYRDKQNTESKVTFPFITLHKPQYPVDKIKKGMNSRDLFMINNDEIYCLGICWFDSLDELLKHTDCPVYVLEDVYLRFKERFDTAFLAYKESLERFCIITDHSIAYKVYAQKKQPENAGNISVSAGI